MTRSYTFLTIPRSYHLQSPYSLLRLVHLCWVWGVFHLYSASCLTCFAIVVVRIDSFERYKFKDVLFDHQNIWEVLSCRVRYKALGRTGSEGNVQSHPNSDDNGSYFWWSGRRIREIEDRTGDMEVISIKGDRKYRTGESPLGMWTELYEAETLGFLWPRSDRWLQRDLEFH